MTLEKTAIHADQFQVIHDEDERNRSMTIMSVPVHVRNTQVVDWNKPDLGKPASLKTIEEEEQPVVKNIELKIAQEAVQEVQLDQPDSQEPKEQERPSALPTRETVVTPTQADSQISAIMTPRRKAFTFTSLVLIIVLNLAALIISLFFDMSKDKYKE